MHAARSGDRKHLVHKTNLSAPFRHQTMISQIFPTLKTAALLDRGFLSFYPPEETAPSFSLPVQSLRVRGDLVCKPLDRILNLWICFG